MKAAAIGFAAFVIMSCAFPLAIMASALVAGVPITDPLRVFAMVSGWFVAHLVALYVFISVGE